VGVISWNRPEWNFVDLALQQIGAISVPMYANITVEDYGYIIKHSEVKMLFVSDMEMTEKVQKGIELSGLPVELFTFDLLHDQERWESILVDETPEARKKLEASKAKVDPEDLFTIIYTSGTTGTPKGVMLNQRNVWSNAIAVHEMVPQIDNNSVTLSFLPLCHIFARTNFFVDILKGTSIYYAESMDTISANIKEVRPTYFSTVPRLLEKVYDKILAKGRELKGPKRWIFFWAMKLGERYEPAGGQSGWYNFQMKWARKLVFSKWQDALGGRLGLIVTGASAVQQRLIRVFWAAEIMVIEGYGLTETSPGVAFVRPSPEKVKIGYVGQVMEDVQIKIAEDGEILVKGPNVMLGYYKSPEMTAEVFTDDGWFKTGDIGELTEDGYLKITDRKKELLKTSGGKYVAPQPIENKIKESILVDQVMVVGDGKNYAAALIIPFFESLKEWCSLHDIEYSTDEEIIKHPRVIEKFEKIREEANLNFARHEQIKKVALLSAPWSIDTGELTATLKLKRKVISERCKNEIEQLYAA
jgi:long-chain acyl-CoA synthetase